MIGAIEVSLAALARNAAALGALVGSSTRTALVVKSNAYGHGLIETARAIEHSTALLCVYALEEAIALRDGGITSTILVLGPVPVAMLDDAMNARVELALWDTGDYARRLAAAARKRRHRARVHIKINSGLNRLGLEAHDLDDAIDDYVRIADLEIVGIFSHLASAEEIDSPYTMYQLDRFERAYAQAAPTFAEQHITPMRHIAASAAAMLWPQTRLDLVRIGIALYGLWPSPQTREAMTQSGLTLEPALRFTSSLVVTRSVSAGSTIGYGATFHAPRDLRIGVVPLGYADGIPRALSNRGALLVDGARCPILGRVAMNLTTIDLSTAPNAQVGSPVTLIGSNGNARVTADDWAGWADTINYEIVARLPREIPRHFV